MVKKISLNPSRFSYWRRWPIILIVTIWLPITACDIEETPLADISVRYVISSDAEISETFPLRYEVLWLGNGVYEVTDRGAIINPHQPFNVHFRLPDATVLRNVLPVDTLSYNFHYLPEPSVRRPRIVVFEDRNNNARLDIEVDRIVAMDGVGYDHYGAIVALVNTDGFLSRLTPEEHNIYYGWTENRYTAFIFAAASPFWSSRVYPIYENAYMDDTIYQEPIPELKLLSAHHLILKTDLICFRQMSSTSRTESTEKWVDSSLNVDAVCAGEQAGCFAFNPDSIPDLNFMKMHSDVISMDCQWLDENLAIIEVTRGYVTCNNCACETRNHINRFIYHRDNLPSEFKCPNPPAKN